MECFSWAHCWPRQKAVAPRKVLQQEEVLQQATTSIHEETGTIDEQCELGRIENPVDNVACEPELSNNDLEDVAETEAQDQVRELPAEVASGEVVTSETAPLGQSDEKGLRTMNDVKERIKLLTGVAQVLMGALDKVQKVEKEVKARREATLAEAVERYKRGEVMDAPDPFGSPRPSRQVVRKLEYRRVPPVILPRCDALEKGFTINAIDFSRLHLPETDEKSTEQPVPALLCTVCGCATGAGDAVLALVCHHSFCPRCFEACLKKRWAALASKEDSSAGADVQDQIPCPTCKISLLRHDVHTLNALELDALCSQARAARGKGSTPRSAPKQPVPRSVAPPGTPPRGGHRRSRFMALRQGTDDNGYKSDIAATLSVVSGPTGSPATCSLSTVSGLSGSGTFSEAPSEPWPTACDGTPPMAPVSPAVAAVPSSGAFAGLSRSTPKSPEAFEAPEEPTSPLAGPPALPALPVYAQQAGGGAVSATTAACTELDHEVPSPPSPLALLTSIGSTMLKEAEDAGVHVDLDELFGDNQCSAPPPGSPASPTTVREWQLPAASTTPPQSSTIRAAPFMTHMSSAAAMAHAGDAWPSVASSTGSADFLEMPRREVIVPQEAAARKPMASSQRITTISSLSNLKGGAPLTPPYGSVSIPVNVSLSEGPKVPGSSSRVLNPLDGPTTTQAVPLNSMWPQAPLSNTGTRSYEGLHFERQPVQATIRTLPPRTGGSLTMPAVRVLPNSMAGQLKPEIQVPMGSKPMQSAVVPSGAATGQMFLRVI